MNKIITKALAVIMAVLFIFPMTAYAEEDVEYSVDSLGNLYESVEVNLSDEEIEEIFENNTAYGAQPYATGLICGYNLALTKDGSTLIVVGKTYGASTVVKAGFKEIVIQKRDNSSSSWVTYIKFVDIYTNNNVYLYSKGLNVATGCQYRATCIHYAKKNALSIQKINNTSNIVTM